MITYAVDQWLTQFFLRSPDKKHLVFVTHIFFATTVHSMVTM